MAVTLHALEQEEEYARLRFCACCPLTPSAPGCTAVGGSRARLTAILSHVDEQAAPPPELGAGVGLPRGRLLGTEGVTMEVPWCIDVTPAKAGEPAAAVTAAPAAAPSPALESATQLAGAKVKGLAEELEALSMDLWRNPELNYRETYACAAIASFLESQGVAVEGNYCGVPTAFRAEVEVGEGPTIAFCAEYDALPEIGHACGHNLIAMAGIGGFLGAKAALEQGLVSGRAVLIGTPAEEAGGGKIDLIQAGAFDDVDCAMMTHPCPGDILCERRGPLAP